MIARDGKASRTGSAPGIDLDSGKHSDAVEWRRAISTVVNGKLSEFFACGDVADGSGFGGNDGGSRLYFDCGLSGTHGKRDIDADGGARIEWDTSADVFFEAARGSCYVVDARRKVG